MKTAVPTLSLILFLITLYPLENVYPYAYKEQGKAYFSRKNYNKAKEIFSKIVKSDPGDGESWLYLAYITESEGDKKQSIEFYKKAVESGRLARKLLKIPLWKLIIYHRNQKQMANTYYYAELYLKYFPYERSVKKIKNKISAEKMWTLDPQAESSYVQGLEELKEKKFTEALASFEKAYSRDSEFMAAKYKAAEILYARKDFAQALRLFEEISRKAPFNGFAHYYVAVLQEKYSNCSAAFEAVDLARKNIQKNSLILNYELPYIESRCYIKEKKYDQAMVHLKNLLRRYPEKLNLWLLAGLVEQNREHTESSIYYFQKAAQLQKNPEAYFRLYLLHEKKKRERQLHYAMNLSSLLLDVNQNNSGNYFEKIPERYNAALVDNLLSALERGRYETINTEFISYIHKNLYKFSQILQDMKKKYPRGPYLHLASWYYRKKDYDNTIQYLQNENSAESYYLLSITYIAKKEEGQALQMLAKAIEKDGSYIDIAKKSSYFKDVSDKEKIESILNPPQKQEEDNSTNNSTEERTKEKPENQEESREQNPQE